MLYEDRSCHKCRVYIMQTTIQSRDTLWNIGAHQSNEAVAAKWVSGLYFVFVHSTNQVIFGAMMYCCSSLVMEQFVFRRAVQIFVKKKKAVDQNICKYINTFFLPFLCYFYIFSIRGRSREVVQSCIPY